MTSNDINQKNLDKLVEKVSSSEAIDQQTKSFIAMCLRKGEKPPLQTILQNEFFNPEID